MKTQALGIRDTYDDAEVRMMLESESLWEKFNALLAEARQDPNQTGLFVIFNHRLNELWIVQDFRGVPGDEGQVLITIPANVIYPAMHPIVATLLMQISKTHKVTPESFLKAKWGVNFPNFQRN